MLTIRRNRILGGPNIWESVPVIMVNVAIGELEGRLARETPGLLRAPHRVAPVPGSSSCHGRQPGTGSRPPPPAGDRPRPAAAGRGDGAPGADAPDERPRRVQHRLRLPVRGGGSGGR